MTTHEIANRLAELCRKGDYEKAQRELYADNAVSIEPAHAQGLQSVEGKENIINKGKMFQGMVEAIHANFVTDPIVVGDHISLGATLDATFKNMGRQKMEEIAVYEVRDGKIVKEEFFFSPAKKMIIKTLLPHL